MEIQDLIGGGYKGYDETPDTEDQLNPHQIDTRSAIWSWQRSEIDSAIERFARDAKPSCRSAAA